MSPESTHGIERNDVGRSFIREDRLRLIRRRVVSAGLAIVLSAVGAAADWQPADGHKMHFPQLPDEEGWDVNATAPMILADDWRCSQSGLVTDIHFWGSWRDME